MRLYLSFWEQKSDCKKLVDEYVSLIEPVNTKTEKVHFLCGGPKLLATKIGIKFQIICCFKSLSDVIAENIRTQVQNKCISQK